MAREKTTSARTAAPEAITNMEREQDENKQKRKNEQEMKQYEEYKTVNKEMKAAINTTNEMVSITIKEMKEQEKKILYMMDEFSAYI